MSFSKWWRRAMTPYWLCSSKGDFEQMKSVCRKAYMAGVKHTKAALVAKNKKGVA